MAKWEVCRIDAVNLKHGMGKFVAIASTLDGEKIIEQSEEFKFNYFDEMGLVHHAKLIAKLLSDGWEPMYAMALPNTALVAVLRRQVSD